MSPNLLSGKLVRLRSPEPEDIDRLYAWENDPSVWRVSHTLAPFSRFQIEQFVLQSRTDIFSSRQMRLMIESVDRPDGAVVGSVDLFDFDPVHARAGVGILVCGEYRNRGYAHEALALLIRYAFSVLQLHQLFCDISPDNNVSLALFTKVGFVQCGVKKDWVRHEGRWHDEWMFQLIADNET